MDLDFITEQFGTFSTFFGAIDDIFEAIQDLFGDSQINEETGEVNTGAFDNLSSHFEDAPADDAETGDGEAQAEAGSSFEGSSEDEADAEAGSSFEGSSEDE